MQLRKYLMQRGIETTTHYTALPETPFGKNNENIIVPEPVVHTVETAGTLLRLPLYPDLTQESAETVCREVSSFFRMSQRSRR